MMVTPLQEVQSTCQSTQLNSSPPHLPQEIWETIFFEYCRYENPARLLRVCRLWKDIILNSGRLWNTVDLGNPSVARRSLKLSRDCLLDVRWGLSWGPATSTSDYRQWAWPHSPRFSRLTLVHTSQVISHIFASVAPELPWLRDLLLIGEGPSNLKVPLEFAVHTPHLEKATFM